MAVLVFFLTLSLLVFVHEFAHFIAAKRSKVEVEEFGFGLPPRIFGKKFKGTLYSLNLLPIGGFVRLKGEGAEVMGFGERGSFGSASRKSRALIIVAGVLGNLLLSYLIFVLLFIVGNPRFVGEVVIEEVNGGTPAEAAGLQKGDTVKSVNGETVDNVSELVAQTERSKGRPMEIIVSRAGSDIPFKVTPRADPPEGQGPLGIRLSVKGSVVYDRSPLLLVPFRAAEELLRSVSAVVFGFVSMVKTLLSFGVPQGVTGVVGIYKLTSEASGIGWRVFLQFVASLSVNLFVFNILPIPALDGGRLLFIGLEKIMKRRIPAKVEAAVNNIGLAFLLAIFVLITISDIRRFWG